MKRASLSQAGASSAPARCRGWLAATATARPPSRANEVTRPVPNSRRSSITLPASITVCTMARGSYSALRLAGSASRNDNGSPPGAAGPVSAPWKMPSNCFVAATAAASSGTRRSTTPLGPITSSGPTASASTRPRPPPSIIAGPPMPRLAPSTATMRSQQPSNAALPAKQRPATMPMRGTCPDSRAKRAKVWQSSPATPCQSTSPGRPPPPSANSTTGSCQRSASASRRSLLAWLYTPCVPASTV